MLRSISFTILLGACAMGPSTRDAGRDGSVAPPGDAGSDAGRDASTPPTDARIDAPVTDRDRDGYSTPDDCNDMDERVHPMAPERCNGVDDDCDGTTDEDPIDAAAIVFRDVDGDGYGDDASAMRACSTSAGLVERGMDCDDSTSSIHPGASEACNGIDDDCDEVVDNGLTRTIWHADRDRDGFGDPAMTLSACVAPPGYVDEATDCDDRSMIAHPGGTEICNGADDDCDLVTDEDACSGCRPWTDGLSHWVVCAGPETWIGARDRCAAMGPYTLAQVESGIESLFIRNAAEASSIGDYWVGANDRDSEGRWIWDGSGAPLTPMILWMDGEPTNAAGENCGYIGNPSIYLFDGDCDVSRAYACEQVL
jgi:hypothetical protein